jgi:hypothetical protein
MGFEVDDEIVVHIHPETGPWSYDPRFNREEWLAEHPDEWVDPDAPVAAAKAEEDSDSYTSWTNDALREELTARGLDTDGKKADLVARLEADDATEE